MSRKKSSHISHFSSLTTAELEALRRSVVRGRFSASPPASAWSRLLLGELADVLSSEDVEGDAQTLPGLSGLAAQAEAGRISGVAVGVEAQTSGTMHLARDSRRSGPDNLDL
jgi:hypothetical protein